MTNVKINAEHTTVTEAIQTYVNNKFASLIKYNNHLSLDDMHAKIETFPDKRAKISATIRDMHAEQEDRDLYAAIDLVVEKLERQLRKDKTKRLNFRQDRTALKHTIKNNEEEEE